MKNVCIIPARGGSKRIPGKNLRSFCGQPIIAYSIQAAQQSGLFDRIIVSTDDPEITRLALGYQAEVPFRRSAATADDRASLTAVCLEVTGELLKQAYTFDNFCCLLPTAPLLNPATIIKAAGMLAGQGYDCVFPVCAFSYPVQRALIIKNSRLIMKDPVYLNTRSQDLEPTYHDSGQFYFMKLESFLKEKKILMENSGSIILDNIAVQDIDTETDWQLAELKYRHIHGKN